MDGTVNAPSHAPPNALTETARKQENSTGMTKKQTAALLTVDFDGTRTGLSANFGKIAWNVARVRVRHC